MRYPQKKGFLCKNVVSLVFMLILFISVNGQNEEISIELKDSVKVGETVTITVKHNVDNNSIESSLVRIFSSGFLTDPPECKQVEKTAECRQKAIKIGNDVVITVEYNGIQYKKSIAINPLDESDFIIDSRLTNVVIFTKEPTEYNLTKIDNKPVGSELSVESLDETVVTAKIENKKVTLTGIAAREAVVILKSYGNEIRRISVKVKDLIDKIETKIDSVVQLNLCTNEAKEKKDSFTGRCSIKLDEIVKKPNLNGEDGFQDLVFTPSNNIKYDKDKQTIEGLALGRAKLEIEPKENPNEISKTVEFNVIGTASGIAINANGGLTTLAPTQRRIILSADIIGLSESISAAESTIKWTIEEGKELVVLDSNIGKSVTVQFVKSGSSATPIKIKAETIINGLEVNGEIRLLVKEKIKVVDFKPLKVELKVIDKRTAKDFFGHVTSKEYFVVEVKLFNKIRKDDENGKYVGDPILVYGSSLEAMVSFKYKVDNKGKWMSAKELAFAKGNTIKLREAEGLVIPQRRIAAKPICKDFEPQQHFMMPYRPLEFETAVNTHDRRDERNKRNAALKVLNGVGTLASIITAVSVPGAGSDLPLGLDKFNNLLIPGFEKFFPSLREVHRQNIISRAMLPFEEVPFGGVVVKYLFFPKGKIRGYVVDKDTAKPVDIKITGINGSDACAVVAVIKKLGRPE